MGKRQDYRLKELEGKTIKQAEAWIENGIPTLEIVFTDETCFAYKANSVPKPSCLYFGADGELSHELKKFA